MADTSFTAQQTTILAAWLNQVNLAIFQGRSPNVGTTTGSANAQVLTLATGSLYTGRTVGDTFGFVAGYSTTTAATLQIVAPGGSLAPAALELNGAALTGGEVIAGQPYIVSWDGTAWQLVSLAGTAFGTSLLQAASAAAARTTLDAAQATNSLTEDTSPDLIADFLSAYDTSAGAEKKDRIANVLGLGVPPGQGVLLNGLVVTSVGSNALTIAIKGADGNDPSASNPVFVAFRSATLGTAGFTVRKITAALSMTVSSGSTLDHASGSACHLFAYLIDNSGTVEVAVSNLPPDYPGTFATTRLISTTAEGGAGAADSATGIYSTTARSNVPWVCVAMMKSTQTTAGTWAANMTQVDQAPFRVPSCNFSVTRSGAQNCPNGWTLLSFNAEEFDPDSTWDATTNFRHQPNVAGVYTYSLSAGITAINIGGSIQFGVGIYGNGALMSMQTVHPAIIASLHGQATIRVMLNGTTDYVDARLYNGDAATQSLDTGGYTRFSGGRATIGGA